MEKVRPLQLEESESAVCNEGNLLHIFVVHQLIDDVCLNRFQKVIEIAPSPPGLTKRIGEDLLQR